MSLSSTFFLNSGSLPPRPESAQPSPAVEDDEEETEEEEEARIEAEEEAEREAEEDEEPDFMYHHFLADTQYGRGFSAEVFTEEDVDMEDELLVELSEFLNEGFISSFGYSKEEEPFDRDTDFDTVEINGL